ncbi:hypothetical protein LSUE1_G008714, partial [Lachnellula suecica]
RMLRPASRPTFRSALLVIFFVLGYFYIYFSIFKPLYIRVLTSIPSRNSQDKDFSCIASSSTGRIVVSIKTGATEAADKIPALMESSLRCAENVFIFSDLEQDIGKYHLHDALDTVAASVTDNNPDFEFYSEQRELWKNQQDLTGLKRKKSAGDPEKLAAWSLDKYKFIHVLEKTWALKPDTDWYILIDADTYIVWSNIVSWLETLDPLKKSYFGSEVNIDGTRFAHGGSGIVLSKGIMQELVRNGTAGRWDSNMQTQCCGDLVLSQALAEYGTSLQDAWPLISGESPSTMPFGPGTPEYWCFPALTFHHVSPADMREFSHFEKERQATKMPLTHAELFKNLTVKSLTPHRENWDNLASEPGEFGNTGGVLIDAVSLDDCIRACEADEKCFQYSHHGSHCYIGMSVRLGYEKSADQEGIWRSGWNKTRLADWASKQPACDEIAFPSQDT